MNQKRVFLLEVNKVTILVNLEGQNKSNTIRFKSLPILPRNGERMSIPFFKELVGDLFFVKEISHDFYDEEQVIFIELTNEFPNKYWEIRIDQALETGEIGYMDLIKNKWEIKKILSIKPRNAW